MIALKRICKHYIDGKRVVTALKDVTINFDVGEFVVVTGASGSGKSTFLNILSGVDYATSGEYLINGVDTDSFDENDWNDYRCKNIGLVYQDYRLFDEFTAEENIQTALALIYSQKKDIRKHAKELMEQTGVIDFANKKVKYLSGGQKQRVAIARALAKNPNILLADEPTANLDDENAKAIVDLLKQISKDKLIVVVTHNDNIFQSALTRKIVLDEGMVVSDSSPITKLQQDKENKPSSRLKSNINFGFGICKNRKPIITLFSIVLIVLFCTMAIYSVCIDMVNTDGEGLINTNLFQNLDKNRYIITKTDKTAFSDGDIKRIKGISSVTDIVTEDVVLDMLAYIENPSTKKDLELYIRPQSDIAEVNYGRLPRNANEIVLSNESGTPLYSMESDEDVFALRTDDNILHSVKIVGWIRDSEHYRQSVYVSPELFTQLYIENYHKFSNVSIIDEDISNLVQNLIPTNEVSSGKIVVTEKSMSGRNINLNITNNSVSLSLNNLSCELLEDHSELNLEYSSVGSLVLVNYSDYANIVTKDYYQISVFSSEKIEPFDNFNVIYPYAINEALFNSDVVVQSLFWFAVCLIISIVLVFASYVFLRHIFKGEVSLNKIKLTLGYTSKDILKYLLIRVGIAVVCALIIISSIYISLCAYNSHRYTPNSFVLLSNIPVLQYIVLSVVICGVYTLLIVGYVMKHAKVEVANVKETNNA